MVVCGPGSAGPDSHGMDVITMNGSVTGRPPGGRGAWGPVRGADGCGGGGGASRSGGASSGAVSDGTPAGAQAVPDGGSVAAGVVWGVLTAAEEPLSIAALALSASVPRSAVAQALERFEEAALVLRVPRGRCASDLWMLAGGVREGIGIAAQGSSHGEPGHGPEPLCAVGGEAPVAHASEADLPSTDGMRMAAVVKPPRLAKGELEARVLAKLRELYPQDLGPLAMSREVGGYSSGAVSNCLERLSSSGRAVLTCQAPKRYAALPPQAEHGETGHAA